jgi:hypothetical protein
MPNDPKGDALHLALACYYKEGKTTMIHSERVEIRKIRHKISEKYGNDLNQLLEHYKALEAKLKASGKYKFALR